MTAADNGLLSVASIVLDRAMASGADSAEVLVRTGRELSAKVRLGVPELLEQASHRALGLRVLRGGRQAICHTSDFSEPALVAFAEETARLARLAEPDPDAGPPDPGILATAWPDLGLFDEAVAALGPEQAMEMAFGAEGAARDYDPRITNSEGATCSVSAGQRALVTSGGFAGAFSGTSVSLEVEAVADDEGGKKRNGSWWDSRRRLGALASPEAIGKEAARRTLAQLGAKKIPSCKVPVVFSPEAGAQVLRSLFGLVSGDAAFRRATFFLEQEGRIVASPLCTVLDDPLIEGAPGSRPFDGEGLPSRRNLLVDRGTFTGFLCDTYAGRRLGRPSTASAGRGVGSAPAVSPSNFFLARGDTPPEALLRDTPEGLYVEQLMGFGWNPVTGDFSKGAEGFWIEGGERAFPVSEVTISARFEDLLMGIDAVGDDLDHKSAIASPTFRVSRMTVAGS
ncbi:MAG: TldD/PmbA family protein [Polyangia bacterium]|jgi:PmbA protein|nr:TldD/PmbA family protein [Polyangia bacterium]